MPETELIDTPELRAALIKKAESGGSFTKAESLFYMVKIMNYDEREAKRIIEITRNTNPDVLID